MSIHSFKHFAQTVSKRLEMPTVFEVATQEASWENAGHYMLMWRSNPHASQKKPKLFSNFRASNLKRKTNKNSNVNCHSTSATKNQPIRFTKLFRNLRASNLQRKTKPKPQKAILIVT